MSRRQRSSATCILVRGQAIPITRGLYTAAAIKRKALVPGHYDLYLIHGNWRTLLSDETQIAINGGEVFDAKPP